MSQAQEAWDAATAGWVAGAELVERQAAPVQRWMMERLDPKPGDVAVDLATGLGPIAMPVAELVAPDGRVIATDISPNMLAEAERRAKERGITNIEFRVMDAQTLDLADDSADIAAHRWGPMLLPEPAVSFAEVRRILRDGGRYAAVVWGPAAGNPWNPVVVQPLLERGLIPPPDDQTAPGQMYSLADAQTFRSLLEGAGFTDVVIEHVEHPQAFDSFDEAWMVPTKIAGGLGTFIAKQPADVIDGIRERFKELIERFREGEGYVFPSVATCAFAR